MKIIKILFYFSCLIFCISCSSIKNPAKIKKYVLFHSSEGDFVVGLYEGTPQHKENFIMNCNEGLYDSCLLYSVKPTAIKKLGIKEGETEKEVLNSNKEISNYVPNEFNPKLINKTGAIAMLNSPNTNDSDFRLFYIVEGSKLNKRLSKGYVNRKNLPIVKKYIDDFVSVPGREHLKDSLNNLLARRMQDTANFSKLWGALRDSVTPLIEKDGIKLLSISPENTKIYEEIGGYPELDNKTTVFGEIVWNKDIFNSLNKLNINIDYLINEKVYLYNNQIMNKCQYKKFVKKQKK